MTQNDPLPDPESEAPDLIDDPVDMPDRRVWLWLAIAVVVLVAAGLGGPYAYRASKVWRARSFIAKAQESFKTLDFTNGAARLHAAVILAPDDTAVLRMAAETLALFGNPDALNFWSRLEQKGDFTRTDRLNRVRSALPVGRLDLAGPDLERLYKDSPKDPDVLGLSVDLFRRMGNLAKAREAVGELLAADPKSRPAQLAAGGLLATDSASPSNRVRGRELLMGLSTTSGVHQTNAWQLLATVPDLEPAELVRLVETITNRPAPGLVHVLAAAEFARRADTNSVAEWLPRVEAAMLAEKKSDGFNSAAIWVLERGAFRWILDQLPVESVRRDPARLPLLLQAKSMAGELREVRSLIDDPESALGAFDRTLFRGTSAWQARNPAEAERHWTEALVLATNRVQVRRLAQAASGAGVWRTAVAAWKRLLENPAERFDAAVGLLRAARETRDARILLDASNQFLQVVPGDVGVRAEAVYLQLVLGDHAEAGLAELERFPAGLRPTDRVQLLTAFGLLRTGKAPDALATVERLTMDWDKAEPRWQALYAALLAANGQREAARRYGAMVPLPSLMASERECFGSWVAALR